MQKTVRPKKSLGQHFLVDQTYCERIVSLANIKQQTPVIEIGAGTGQLTQFLLGSAEAVLAIEFDTEMIKHLEARFQRELSRGHLLLLRADVLSLDWKQAVQQLTGRAGGSTSPQSFRVVGNLPYNIATRILLRMTQTPYRFHSYTLMTQKEVAERILAGPGSKDYGYLSLLVEYHFSRERGFDVPAGAFRPPPKVLSHVFHLRPAPPGLSEDDYGFFIQLIKSSFRHRRKTLWNNLLSQGYGRVRLEDGFRSCHIDPRARPEELGLEVYLQLSQMLS